METTQNIPSVFDAIKQDNIESVVQLLKNGTDPNIRDNSNHTPLMYASSYNNSYNNFTIVKLLLEFGADLNTRNVYWWTPLMYASIKNKKDIIMLLIDYGADCNLINKEGKTALDYEGGDFIREYLESKEHQIILK